MFCAYLVWVSQLRDTFRLIIIDQQRSSSPGGTHVLQSALSAFHNGKIQTADAEECIEIITAEKTDVGVTPIVFCQQEGTLNEEYARWAQECLSLGAVVIELNVFNLPSRHRPLHPNYIMGTYTIDGLNRYLLRSFGFGKKPVEHALILPNIVSQGPEHTGTTSDNKTLRILRAGRPDPIKWSNWEIEVAMLLAQARPNTLVSLTLIGSPFELSDKVVLPKNLKVIMIPYLEDLPSEYRNHDVYLHYSRIGETFGNTLAEAYEANLLVIGGFDSRWDLAPLTFLPSERSILATRPWIKRNINEIWNRIDEKQAKCLDPEGIRIKVASTPEDYLRRLLSHADAKRIEHRLPLKPVSLRARSLNGVRLGIAAPAWEILRGLHLRLTSK